MKTFSRRQCLVVRICTAPCSMQPNPPPCFPPKKATFKYLTCTFPPLGPQASSRCFPHASCFFSSCRSCVSGSTAPCCEALSAVSTPPPSLLHPCFQFTVCPLTSSSCRDLTTLRPIPGTTSGTRAGCGHLTRSSHRHQCEHAWPWQIGSCVQHMLARNFLLACLLLLPQQRCLVIATSVMAHGAHVQPSFVIVPWPPLSSLLHLAPSLSPPTAPAVAPAAALYVSLT
jgi:hypothetical protein